jgi:hypothetical protein
MENAGYKMQNGPANHQSVYLTIKLKRKLLYQAASLFRFKITIGSWRNRLLMA